MASQVARSFARAAILHIARQVVDDHDHDHDHEDHDHDHAAEESSSSSGSNCHAGHCHGPSVELDPEALAAMCSGGTEGDVDSLMGLRVAAIFIILVTALLGTIFPIIARRTGMKRFVPDKVFDFAKYFGSGVIIATAFIHLLYHAIITLDTPCLGEGWHIYPWALAICMIAIFLLFFVELLAFRWGSARLAKAGTAGYDPHGHAAIPAAAPRSSSGSTSDIEKNPANTTTLPASPAAQLGHTHPHTHAHSQPHGPLSHFSSSALAQAIGIFILEFGILLHSVLIGLMLAVTDSESFRVLLVVLVFHQTFEGLALGARLSLLNIPSAHRFLNIPLVAALLYAISTPVGIAVGLGVRSTYNPHSATASAVSGVMDSVSAGVLLYTGLVELIAHEFLFNPQMLTSSNAKLAYACGCMTLGAAMMALLGRWA